MSKVAYYITVTMMNVTAMYTFYVSCHGQFLRCEHDTGFTSSSRRL